MSDFFDDPRSRRSEELAHQAERTRGDVAECERLFAEAAELEEAVAREVPTTETRIRGVLAISAVALWLKARRFDLAQRAAADFLKGRGIEGQDRADLESLISSGAKAR